MPRKPPPIDADAPAMKVLFADDEPSLQELMRKELPRMGHTVTVCPDGVTAIAALERETFDCLLVDLDMPGAGGLDVIRYARQNRPDAVAVIMTGKPTGDSALDAYDLDVFAYLRKPTRLAGLANTLGRVAQRITDRRAMRAMRHRLERREGDAKLIGDGEPMTRLRSMIHRVGPTQASVLIRGETGCGKELVATAIHAASHRADRPLVPINCGALPEHLIESELFGHCRGAFTGADTARTGLFEVADGGTIFLDEIGELPLSMQAKLLRVLETGDIRRLGDNQTTRVDVRLVCATHRNLEQMVADGAFREDLMFRINTFELTVPPLRERRDDLPALVEHLVRRHANVAGDAAITDAAMERLAGHNWPGNVRELANVIEHATILCDRLPIDVDDLPDHFDRRQLREEVRRGEPKTLAEMQSIAIEDAMKRHDGDKPAVAKELGISLKTLYNRLNAA